MAVQQVLVDDIDGSTSDIRTVRFELDGASYSIDLGPENRERLHEQFQPFIDKGRKVRVESNGRRPVRAARPTRSADSAKIRAWARENGLPVSDRGRLNASIREAYAKSNGHSAAA